MAAMFLKSLVARGFKSFADKTTFVFEPGITVIVGPNGSGKTNTVEAISWVLGEQGPRSLRGGKMEDVIFAGSPQRPALGMAEVTLTIDNSAGLLPIEFTEVTVSRTLFRSGESEYRLNGQPCRLLDIQEVLSDTGVGREQHTIIGQGQLDSILQSDAMSIRAFIEEAAGVAKHRRRKDRALRRIASAEQNIARLSDLAAEIRRQLRPLREQAEVAKRHEALSDELSRVLLISAARELAAIRSRIGGGGGVAHDPEELVRAKEDELTLLEQSLTQAERRRSEHFSESERLRETAWSLSRSAERLAALSKLASERERTLEAELGALTEERFQARIDELERERSRILESIRDSAALVTSAEAEAETRKQAVEEASDAVRALERQLTPLRTRRRESTTETIRVRGEIAALTGSREAAEREATRLNSRKSVLEESRRNTEVQLEEARAEFMRLEREEDPLSRRVAKYESELQRLEAERSSEERRLRDMERKASLWRARSDVHASEPSATRIASQWIDGVFGALNDLISVPGEYRRAVTAIAGPLNAVLVVRDLGALARVIEESSEQEGIGVLVADHDSVRVPGATPIVSVIQVNDPAAGSALRNVYLADDLLEASRMAAAHPGATFVTVDGSVASGGLVARGPADAAERASELEDELHLLENRVAEIDREIRGNRAGLDKSNQKLNEIDAGLAAVTERIAGFDREMHAAEREAHVVAEQERQAQEALSSLSSRLESLKERLPDLESSVEQMEAEVERLQEVHARALSSHESAVSLHEEARVAAGRAAERRLLLDERLTSLKNQIRAAELEAEGLEGRRHQLTDSIEAARRVGTTAAELNAAAMRWADESDAAYRRSRLDFDEAQKETEELRTARAALVGALTDLREVARREEVDRSELKFRARLIEERMREEWRTEPDQAVSRFGHVWEVEDDSQLNDPLERNATMEPDALNRKRTRLERDIETVGTVNPLAAREFQTLADREAFLNEQLADVRASRRDLMKVVTSVDDRIREMFLSAFEDVAREYERLFVLLFPGGQGRLELSDPTDPLETGVEVEARPGGKNLKRLSLLSGGERALSALAFLFAIFSARPSPFYVLDEVEAALDDINLHRFLSLVNNFRETSQLLVVTHQKRTMEVADVLYGISIRPDGASRVISQKISLSSQDSVQEREQLPGGRISSES